MSLIYEIIKGIIGVLAFLILIGALAKVELRVLATEKALQKAIKKLK